MREVKHSGGKRAAMEGKRVSRETKGVNERVNEKLNVSLLIDLLMRLSCN